jgi:hypothetical protein
MRNHALEEIVRGMVSLAVRREAFPGVSRGTEMPASRTSLLLFRESRDR